MVSDEAKQVIKDAVDVESLLLALGFRITRNTINEIRATCRIHGGDNPTAFSMRLDSKKWRCFTRHCEEDARGNLNNDLISLVMLSLNLPFPNAIQFLADFVGYDLTKDDPDSEQAVEYRRQQDIKKYIRSINRASERKNLLSPISEERIQKYSSHRNDYFEKQGFLPETLEIFQVGLTTDDYGIERATVPVRDHHGRLVSVSARRTDGDEEPRYLLEAEFKKDQVLYNLFMARQSESDTVIIVEGFKAAWAVVEAGFFNVVACMGSVVTYGQFLLLCETHFTNCLLMLDGDEGGKKGTDSSINILKRAFNVVPTYLDYETSPDDFDRNELKQLVDIHLELF